MIKSITVTNYLGESIKLDLARPDKSGFVVKAVTGLGPGKATINTTDVITNDGGLFNSARMTSRNIVISLEYFWRDKTSIEDTRQLSYKYFPLKKKLTLLIETDNRLAEIEGYVETNDPNIFSNAEGSDISIICPDPYFRSREVKTTVFRGLEALFEFPFSNESTTEPLLEMGSIISRPDRVITYNGDIETGITIRMHAIGPVNNITIYNLTTREVMRINTSPIQAYVPGSGSAGLVEGDDVVICTEKGKKSITLYRGGETINILGCLDKDVDWFQLTQGNNVFTYLAEDGGSNLEFSIENNTLYEGV